MSDPNLDPDYHERQAARLLEVLRTAGTRLPRHDVARTVGQIQGHATLALSLRQRPVTIDIRPGGSVTP